VRVASLLGGRALTNVATRRVLAAGSTRGRSRGGSSVGEPGPPPPPPTPPPSAISALLSAIRRPRASVVEGREANELERGAISAPPDDAGREPRDEKPEAVRRCGTVEERSIVVAQMFEHDGPRDRSNLAPLFRGC